MLKWEQWEEGMGTQWKEYGVIGRWGMCKVKLGNRRLDGGLERRAFGERIW